jgi:hypothetical protein
MAAWLLAQAGAGLAGDAVLAVAVDGKTVRGAVQPDGRAVHLLAAMTSGGAVIAQREVGHKTNEITQVKPLLDPLDLRGAVVTLDALCRRRHKASYGDPVVMPTCVGTCRQPSGMRVTGSA